MSQKNSNLKSRSAVQFRDRLFWSMLSAFGLLYLCLIVSMIVADFRFASWNDIRESLQDPKIQYSISLSLMTCTISAIASMWVAVPTGFVLARMNNEVIRVKFARSPFVARLAIAGRYFVDTLMDIPILLPPLVVGISLLVLFQTSAGRLVDQCAGSFFAWLGYPAITGITYEIPAVILAQFTVAAAFAIRTMRNTFEQIDDRPEQIGLTLGASRAQTFWRIALPQAWSGGVAAFTLAWARSLGEFGPVLIFAGTSRMKTEVLSTTVYLNFQIGNLRAAVVASLILVTLAILVLVATRLMTLGSVRNGNPR